MSRTLVAKRTMDLLLGTVLALLALPVVLVLAVAVAIDLRTWPFFVQERVGKGGRTFSFPKIRTLPAWAPASADKYAVEGLELSWLRRTLRNKHLDELPQLFLVPIGHMSLVGPRPEMPVMFERYTPAFTELRSSVRPGCTGLWQLGPDACRMIYEAPEYDAVYLEVGGPKLDVWILYRTVRSVLPGARCITLDDVPGWARGRGLLVEPATTPELAPLAMMAAEVPTPILPEVPID